MSISPSDFLTALRNEACRMLEELKPVIDKANDLYERLDRIAEDCEDAAQLVASSDIEPNMSASVPERSGLTRQGGPNE